VIRLLDDPSGGVRINAIAILARHHVEGASGALIRKLEDSKWYVRQQAARALGELGAVRARVSLMRAAVDPRRAVGDAASEALARIERPRTHGR
jgi:HEAT repeat protein